MHRRVRGLVIAALALIAAGCANDTKSADSPEVVALRRQMQMLSDGQFGSLWNELHPAQQALMSRDAYVLCAGKQFSGTTVKVGSVKKIVDEPIQIPGTDIQVASRAITIEMSLNGLKDTETFHEVLDGKSWRFTVVDPSAATDC